MAYDGQRLRDISGRYEGHGENSVDSGNFNTVKAKQPNYMPIYIGIIFGAVVLSVLIAVVIILLTRTSKTSKDKRTEK